MEMDESGPVEFLPPPNKGDKYGASYIYRGSPAGDEIKVTHVNHVYEYERPAKKDAPGKTAAGKEATAAQGAAKDAKGDAKDVVASKGAAKDAKGAAKDATAVKGAAAKGGAGKDGAEQEAKPERVRETNGILFIGEKGKLFVNRGTILSEPAGIAKTTLAETDKKIADPKGHRDNWLRCIETRERPVADVEIGARSVTVCHLVNLTYWNHQKLQWDPKAWTFTGDNAAEANEWIHRERRAKYPLPEA